MLYILRGLVYLALVYESKRIFSRRLAFVHPDRISFCDPDALRIRQRCLQTAGIISHV